MSIAAKHEEGTSLILDTATIAAKAGFTITGTVTRLGDLVLVSATVINDARAAWDKEVTYALGTLATEGGKTYKSIKAENLNHKPSASATWWEEVANPTQVFDLPETYGDGVIVATYSLVGGTTKKLQAFFGVDGGFVDSSGNFTLD